MKLRSVNQKFLRNLKDEFGEMKFSTWEAETLYHRDHWVSWKKHSRSYAPKIEMDGWGRMSARNTLCAAVHNGLLRRIERGWYQF